VEFNQSQRRLHFFILHIVYQMYNHGKQRVYCLLSDEYLVQSFDSPVKLHFRRPFVCFQVLHEDLLNEIYVESFFRKVNV
jgi:hypothetical protein